MNLQYLNHNLENFLLNFILYSLKNKYIVPAKNKKKQESTDQTSILGTTSAFAELGHYTEMEEQKEKLESMSELHQEIDKIWKLLITGRQKCRSLQYQFWAAVLIEKEGLPEEDGGLEELMESILIDPKMGDHHIANLPLQYHEKMRQCTIITCMENKNIGGNVNKYSASLKKWYNNLIKEIKDQIGNDYVIKDPAGNNIINPLYLEKIKEIIKNNGAAKTIRSKLNLSEHLQLEEKEEKALEPKPKTGMDYYLDYLLSENNETAQASLKEAAKLGYIEDNSGNEKSDAIVSDEYYSEIYNKCYKSRNFKLLEKVLINGAVKGSAVAQHLLGMVYELGIQRPSFNNDKKSYYISANPIKSSEYCELAAKQGFAPAQHCYAYNLRDGFGSTKKNMDEAFIWFKKSAEQGYVNAQNDLAIWYSKRGNATEAISWWHKAIDQGDAFSKRALGNHYMKSGNPREGLKLLTESAIEGVAQAQHDLGSYYMNGDKIPQDVFEGIKWMEKAAAQRFSPSIDALEQNKSYLNHFRKRGKCLEYYIPVSSNDERRRTLNNLIKKITVKDIDEQYKMEVVNEQDWEGFKIKFPSNMITKEIQELLGIERINIDKITSQQREDLERTLPKATIEEDPKNCDKILLTCPIIGDREEYRKFLDQTIKKIMHPGPVVIHPMAKSASDSKMSDRAKS